jgi:hypothetical protein
MIEKSMAAQKPDILKPLMTLEARRIRKALITKVKRPRVRILTGRVRMISSGFKVTLITAKSADNQRAVQNPSTLAPGMK